LTSTASFRADDSPDDRTCEQSLDFHCGSQSAAIRSIAISIQLSALHKQRLGQKQCEAAAAIHTARRRYHRD
jgi:hypothetical protein